MNIYEYADTLNVEIKATYYPNQDMRWCVHFERGEIKDRPDSVCLTSAHGNGKTIDAALTDYIKDIRGKTLVLNAFDDARRREFLVPMSLSL